MLTLISFLVGSSQNVIVGILDKVAESVGVSVSVAGQLVTVFALANALGTPIVMVATAKMAQRQRLLLALVIMLLGIVIIALPGFGYLMISRIVLGVATGVFVATAYGLAQELASPGHEVGAMSNITLGFSGAMVFGVPLGRIVAAAYDWKVIFWGIGVLVVLGFFTIARTIPSIQGVTPVPLGKQLVILKKPIIAVSFGVTLFMFIGYSVLNTYITPFLTSGVRVSGGEISALLFALGIMSLFGSKLGGFLADRMGTARTLGSGMVVQVVALALLPTVARTPIVSIPVLMLWMISAWTFAPPQNFNLVSLVPEASGIMLSLNNSFVQFGFAVGAAIGGIVVGGPSTLVICWVGSAALAIAVVSFSYTRVLSKRDSSATDMAYNSTRF
jgi:MFS transporter, DHA1 family, putative efflux transporter